MKTTIQIKHLRPRSTDGLDPYRNTKWYSEEEIIKARHHVQVFINIDRDLHNKVTMDDVDKGLDEFLKILKIGEQK